MNIDEEITYEDKDFSKQENLKTGKLSSNIYRMVDENKEFDFIVNKLSEKSGNIEYKICGINFCNHFFTTVNFEDENIKSYIYIFYIHIKNIVTNFTCNTNYKLKEKF